MSTTKEKVSEEPLVNVCGVEDTSCKSPTTINFIERSNMTTMEAKEAPSQGMESKSTHFGESSRLSSFPMLLTLLELAQPAFAHGASSSSGDESWPIQEGQKQVTENYPLPGDMGNAPTPALVQIGCQSTDVEHGIMPQPKEVIDDHGKGKAPMGITSQRTWLTPPSLNDCCNLNPVLNKSEHEAIKINDPSKAPKGSLIHTIYKQLLDAGEEGMTLQELLAGFEQYTAWKNLESNWREEVQFHVENNSHVREVKRYSLHSKEQPGLQQLLPKPSSTGTCVRPMVAPDIAGGLELSLGITRGCNIKVPPLRPTPTKRSFVMNHPKGASTRSTAELEKIPIEQTELHKKMTAWIAAELEKIPIEQTEVHKKMTAWIAAWVADPSIPERPTSMQLPKWSTKRKCSSDDTEQPDLEWRPPSPIQGPLIKREAEILYWVEKKSAAKRARFLADKSP